MDKPLSTDVELSISCRNLYDADVLSKSDPLVVVFQKLDSGKWDEIGRTEMIKNNLNPDFSKKFILNYHFEVQQVLSFAVYDIDSDSQNLEKHDFLGRCEATLGEIVSNGSIEKRLKDTPSSKDSTIILSAEEVSSCMDEITMKLSGRSLDRKDFFGLSDPFLTFYRVNEDNSITVVHRTETIKNTLNPNWKEFVVSIQKLANGDYDRPLVISCYDWNRNGREKLIGTLSTSVKGLLQEYESGSKSFELINPKKEKKSSKYKNSGMLCLDRIHIEKVHSFLEYVQGGTELSCCIAIDFTASNGSPQVPGTLHYSTNEQPSQYAVALQAVGEVISDYDSDNLFPAFGFGACIPPDYAVSHCFPLNGHMDNPYCEGIAGTMAAYAHSLRTVKLHGPTNFAPIINTVASISKKVINGSQYSILLILTDGIISDLSQTRAAIVNASVLPLSIIIVGVGTANFDEMVELDGDEVRLSYRGREAERDIVQFVPFRDFHNANSVQASKRELSKAVLAEIPDQLVSYMRMHNLKPLHTPSHLSRDVNRNGSTQCPYPSGPYNHSGTLPSAPPEYQ